MTKNQNDMADLDGLFAAARAQVPGPSDDLMARVLADAQAEQATLAVTAARPTVRPAGRFEQMFRVLGGWPAMGGLATASVVGLWLGINPPVPLQAVSGGYLSPDVTAFMIDTSAEIALGFDEEAL